MRFGLQELRKRRACLLMSAVEFEDAPQTGNRLRRRRRGDREPEPSNRIGRRLRRDLLQQLARTIELARLRSKNAVAQRRRYSGHVRPHSPPDFIDGCAPPLSRAASMHAASFASPTGLVSYKFTPLRYASCSDPSEVYAVSITMVAPGFSRRARVRTFMPSAQRCGVRCRSVMTTS